ncbi:MAG: SAM-dependent DNA methyltransferase [Bacteroidales bacterium]|nr:MAG: SAM-dependent DNA methyltransferase [Bacteroidales bacterium]
MLQNNSTLKSLIDKLWNNFWSGGISNPLTAIEQISYLIFMKRLDDLEAKRERDAEFTGEKYTSRFSGKFKVPGSSDEVNKSELRWSNFKRRPADEMLLHVQTKVFPFLKELNGGTSPFTKHMANSVFIMPKASLLVEAINIIEDIFKEIEKDASEGGHAFQDIQGDVYEMLLSEIATSGKNGQFRTPRHIIKLMAELVAPQLGQRVADPACGTGGFLLGAYQYILTDLVRKTTLLNKEGRPKGGEVLLEKDEDGFERATMSSALNEYVKDILEDSFYGFDIDTTMVRLGLMNLMMHGIDEPHIDYKDTLSKKFNEDSQYDVIMANPPFTGNIDKGDINESLKLPTTKTELLFVERIFNMLKMGGTAAVVVPQGVLFGSGKAFTMARKKLVDEAELKAVITLPSGVFKPYAGVSTSILIFTKGGQTENIWFYDMQADGYSLDDKRNKIDKSDIPDIIVQYNNRRTLSPVEGCEVEMPRTSKFFFVPKSEIVENEYDLSISKYKEEVYEEVNYEKSEVILKKLNVLELSIINGLKEIEGLTTI